MNDLILECTIMCQSILKVPISPSPQSISNVISPYCSHFILLHLENSIIFFFLQTFYGLFQIADAAAIIFKVLTLVIYFLLVPSSPPRNPPPPVPSFPPTTSNKMSGPPQLPPRPIPHSPVSPGRAPAPLPSPTRATAGAVGGRSATGK